jgi:STE24 endopeptidase
MKSALLGAYLFVFVCDQVLEWWNLHYQRRQAGRIPASFRSHFDASTVERALAYETDKKKTALIEGGLSAALFAWFMFGGWLPVYDRWTLAAAPSFIAQGTLFFLGLLLIRLLLDLPFSWYRNFHTEARYGFNTMTPRLWLTDVVKSTVIALILYGLLLVGILWLVRSFPQTWWIWAWGFVTFFGLFVMVISPYVIEPLFFKFAPIEQPELVKRIRNMAEKAGLHAERIFQVDASRRSRHGNAYFTGLGRQKRIVLFDTLLGQMSDNQTLAVLAHEIGHWKYRHMTRRLLTSTLLALGGFYLAADLIHRGVLPDLLNMTSASFAAQIMTLMLLVSLVGFPLAPLGHIWSRRQERQADRFACKLTGRPGDLAEALIKLARENLAALHPHPWYAWFHYSHPPIVQRVETLQKMADAAEPAAATRNKENPVTNRNMFDELADDWDDNPRIAEMASAFVSHIRQYVPLSENTRALDFGCGTGGVGMRLSLEVHSIAMIDNSQGMLSVLDRKITRAGISNLHLRQGDLFQPGLEVGGYDLAYTLMAMHHVKEIYPLLDRFHGLLKQGGYLCIGDLEPEDGSFHGEGMKVHRGFAPQQLESQLRDIGFTRIRTGRMLVVEKPAQDGKHKRFPLFFLVARKG